MMKSNESERILDVLNAPELPRWLVWTIRAFSLAMGILIATLLASCSSLGKPEQQPSNLAPACNQREPALDSGDPPEGGAGGPSTDWMAWAQAYVRAQWAVVDRDNKRAATADCLDDLARSRK